jgi:hypothetical protein
MVRDEESILGTDYSLLAKPDLRTSRRNFITAASVLATAGVLALVGSKPAQAKKDDDWNDGIPGCEPSRNTPPKCDDFADPHHCFLSGTRIATPAGEVAIDDLRIGDMVTTASSAPKPIKWIGRNHYVKAASGAWHPELLPVKVAKFALDDFTPHADLYLSPGHALYLHGLLIDVRHLVNGRSIVARQHAEALALDYFHIELEGHDVVLAEGVAAETWAGNDRSGFDNAEEYERLYGASHGPARDFAPHASLNGGRQELRSRLRSALSPIYDARTPFDVVRDHLASRAELGLAA